MKIDLSFPIMLYCYVVHQYRGRGADKGRAGDSQGEGSGVAFTEACLLQAYSSILLATNRNWIQRAFIQHVILQLLLGPRVCLFCKRFCLHFLPLTFSWVCLLFLTSSWCWECRSVVVDALEKKNFLSIKEKLLELVNLREIHSSF